MTVCSSLPFTVLTGVNGKEVQVGIVDTGADVEAVGAGGGDMPFEAGRYRSAEPQHLPRL